jgi:hypothetical protein
MYDSPAQAALSIESVKGAEFWLTDGLFYGVVADKETGIEFDVRQTESGWNVNDDEGRNHVGDDLPSALRAAIIANCAV